MTGAGQADHALVAHVGCACCTGEREGDRCGVDNADLLAQRELLVGDAVDAHVDGLDIPHEDVGA